MGAWLSGRGEVWSLWSPKVSTDHILQNIPRANIPRIDIAREVYQTFRVRGAVQFGDVWWSLRKFSTRRAQTAMCGVPRPSQILFSNFQNGAL